MGSSEESQNLTWQALERANREMMERLERELVLAFHRGFDGVDAIVGSHSHGFEDAVKFRTIIQPWNEGDEPHRPPWASDRRRYEFDGMTYQDIRDAHKINDFE